MESQNRSYPLFSACGLNCGLCPRFHTDGSSRCPGCAGEGFSEVHPACGILSCCRRKGIEYCFQCEDFPCPKYNSVDSSDSFITHRNQILDLEKAKHIGMEAYEAQLDEKTGILERLLESYNDGRRKSYFCLAINLLELHDINVVMEQIDKEVEPESTMKVKAAVAVRLFDEMAAQKGVSLKLRK